MNQPATISQLQQLLAAHGVDTSTWGQSKTKSLNDLWLEVQAGETVLEENPLRRMTTFVQIIIRRQGNVLIEEEQEMANGAVRGRNRPPSEKMLPGETVVTAALRGLQQELDVSPEQVMSLAVDALSNTAEAPSPSYPGLITRYTIRRIEATITGLPTTDFSTSENSSTDPVRKHFWRWLPEVEAEKLFKL